MSMTWRATQVSMTKCVKPLRCLATSSTKSSKWSVLIGRAGRLSTKSHQVSKWFHAFCHILCHSKLEGRDFKMRVDDVASDTSIWRALPGGEPHRGAHQQDDERVARGEQFGGHCAELGTGVGQPAGRGLHSFTLELNLATPGHIHELSWVIRWTEELKLSCNLNECKPQPAGGGVGRDERHLLRQAGRAAHISIILSA